MPASSLADTQNVSALPPIVSLIISAILIAGRKAPPGYQARCQTDELEIVEQAAQDSRKAKWTCANCYRALIPWQIPHRAVLMPLARERPFSLPPDLELSIEDARRKWGGP